jgi:hypothetical protein
VCALSPLFAASANSLHISEGFFLQMIPLLYLYVFMRFNREHRISRSVLFNLFADGHFFLAGLCAWIAASVR